jgi:hypothetical protein
MANEITVYKDPNGIIRYDIPAPIMLRLQNWCKNQILKQEIENEDKELREMFAKVMEANGINSIELEELTITFRKPHTRTTIDSKRLKAEKPTIAEEYSKVSTVPGSAVLSRNE